MAETKIKFIALGRIVEYTINNVGNHETLEFDGILLEDSSGDVGPYRSGQWAGANLLHGASRASAEYRVLQDHAEGLLADILRRVPELYADIDNEKER